MTDDRLALQLYQPPVVPVLASPHNPNFILHEGPPEIHQAPAPHIHEEDLFNAMCMENEWKFEPLRPSQKIGNFFRRLTGKN